MNVLLVLNAAAGGATLSALDVIPGLARRGHKFYCIVPPGGPTSSLVAIRNVMVDTREIELQWWNKHYTVRSFKRPVLWLWESLRSGFHIGTLMGIAGLIRRWKIDLVHSNTALTIDGALAARVTGVPHVWHIREQIGSNQLIRFWLPERRLARTFAALSSALIANSEETKKFFVRNGVGERVEVIFNGVSAADFETHNGNKLRRQLGVHDGQILIGMVANLTALMKRHEMFVRAAAEVLRLEPDVRFVVFGYDPDRDGGYRSSLEYTRQLKSLAIELGLRDKFFWAGHVPDPRAIMGSVSILVHPSDRESFGRVAIEAMAAAKPVIAVAAGGVKEIVEDGRTGFLVPPGNHLAVAGAILKLIRSPEIRESLGQQGRQRVKERFSLERTVERISSIYERFQGQS